MSLESLAVHNPPHLIPPFDNDDRVRYPRLWLACERKVLHEVVICLRQVPSPDINVRGDYNFSTPLHSFLGHHRNRISVWSNPKFEYNAPTEILDLLLENGADPLALTTRAETPLHFAIRHYGATLYLQTLLSRCHGLDVNSRDSFGRTAIFWTARYGHRCHKDALMEHGADPKIPTTNGSTVLHLPMDHCDIGYFMSKGVNINGKKLNGNTPIHQAVYMFTSAHLDPNTAIQWIRDLLTYRPDLTIVNNAGITAEQEDLSIYEGGHEITRLFTEHHFKDSQRKLAVAESISSPNSMIGTIPLDLLQSIMEESLEYRP
jgi:ankyrin repeat protein